MVASPGRSRVVVGLLLVGLLTACSDDDGESVEPEVTVTSVDRTADGSTMMVWLEPGADAQVVAGIEDAILEIGDVTIVDYMDGSDALAELRAIFADDPGTLDLLTPDRLPTAFKLAVDLVDRATVDKVGRLVALPQVRDVRELDVLPGADELCGLLEPRPMLLVWMEPDADQASDANVVDSLEALGAVVGYEYIDQAATFAEFEEFFADNPQMVEAVSPQDLPPSYRVTMSTAEDARAARSVFESITGVRDVVAPEPCPGVE